MDYVSKVRCMHQNNVQTKMGASVFSGIANGSPDYDHVLIEASVMQIGVANVLHHLDVTTLVAT